jgi:DNA repair exonuclease SbcCD ATPase subunit
MVVLQVDKIGQVDIRDDPEHQYTETPSPSHYPELYFQQPQPHQQPRQLLTFDEWEAAIVRSISERPDEIIDIFERYAEGRGEYQEQESLSYRREPRQTGCREDHSMEDSIRDEGRQEVETRDGGWSIARQSFVAEFVNEFRTKIAQLTYPSSPSMLAISNEEQHGPGGATMRSAPNPQGTQSILKTLQADLDAEQLKSKSLALRLKESKRMYQAKLEEMWERVQYLETHHHQTCEDDSVDEKPTEMYEEASQMEDTLVTGEKGTDKSLQKELEDKVSVLTKALADLQRENEELKDAISGASDNQQEKEQQQANDLKNLQAQRIFDLEQELEKAHNEMGEMQARWEELDSLVLSSERVLEKQRKKMEKMAQSAQRTTELYEHERSARLSLERINETTQIILEKLHRKVEERRDDIEELTDLLAQKDSMIQAMYVNFKDESAKIQNMSSVII